jgi:hypothetical protein
MFDRLAALPRLSEAMEQGRLPGGKPGGPALKNFLDQLGRDVAGEMDRRSLADVENFLAMLLQGNQAGEVPSESVPGGGREAENRSDNDKTGGKGEFAGDQPGSPAGSAQTPPTGASAITRLQGILRVVPPASGRRPRVGENSPGDERNSEKIFPLARHGEEVGIGN